MAAGQAVKVRPKTSTKGSTTQATSTSQLVNQKQSQELAQTLVHGSISCIAYLRDLFPDKCFEKIAFSSSDKHVLYQDYASGKSQSQSRSGGKIRALQRGHNDNVDSFLDMLEKGAFEALQKKVLRAIQINISEQVDNPNHIVESYTFTFSYQDSPEGAKTLAGVTMQDPRGADTTVKNVKYALQMFIRKIIALCETLPELPARRYLHMQLYYTDDCEQAYEPPGFAACKDTRLWFAEHDGWTKQTEDCGVLDAGYHAVSLKLSHLQPDFEVAESQGETVPIALPSELQYASAILGQDDVDTSIGSRLAKRKLVQRTAAEHNKATANEVTSQRRHTVPTSSQQESMEVDDDDDDHPLPAIGQMSLETRENLTKSQAPDTTAPETQASTQTREDRATRGRLAKMMIPSPQAQNAEETQLVNSPIPQFSAMGFLSQMPQLELSEVKAKDLKKRKLPRNTRGKSKCGDDSGDTISCECGHRDEEDDMVYCHFCGRWQHLVCYGYQDSDDPRMPDVHACYKCLLKEKEGPLLTELEHLALLRKGASVAMKGGIHSDRQFAEALHCDAQTAAKVIKHLRNEGFLLRTPNANKAGFKKTGKPTWHIVENGEERAGMMSMYFDPTTKIAHHFEIPRTLPDTIKTTQFPLPPQDVEMSAMNDSVLPRDAGDTEPIAVPYSMDITAERIDPEDTPTAKHQELLPHSQTETLAEGAQRKELFLKTTIQDTPTSRTRTMRSALSERNPNPSTPVRPTSKRHAYEQEEDEPSTPAPGRKKIKASRAPVVNVGRSPTTSVASFYVGDDEGMGEDDDL